MADAIQKAAHEALAVAMPDLAEALASSLRDAMGHAFVCGYRAGREAAAAYPERPSRSKGRKARERRMYRIVPPEVAGIVREAWPRGLSLDEINGLCRPYGWQFDDAHHVGNCASSLGVRRTKKYLLAQARRSAALARAALADRYGSGPAGHETHNTMEGR